MALRSGYYGLKNATKKILEKLAADTAGMKIIKSFGDGLSLSNAGKLSVTAATASKMGGFKVGSGLSMEDGVLSVENPLSVVDINLNTITVNKGTLDTDKSFIQRYGNVVTVAFRLTGITAANGDAIITLPEWMAPKTFCMIPCLIGGTLGVRVFQFEAVTNGVAIKALDAIENLNAFVCLTSWIVEQTEPAEPAEPTE